MAAYSNFQMPPYGQQQPPPQQGYGQPQPQYGAPPPGQFGAPPQYQQQQQQQQQGFNPYASAPPARSAPRRSLSMGSAREISNQMAMVSFDPYASTQTVPAAPAYSNYSLPPQQPPQPHEIDIFTASAPPTFSTDDMTTSPMTAAANPYGFAQPPPQQQQQQQQQFASSGVSTMSDMTMFSSAPPTTTETALVPKNDPKDDAVLANVDPKILAEQEKIYADIQARNKMMQIRKKAGLPANAPSSRAMVPHNGGQRPGAPVRTRSMPHPNSSRGQDQSVARGGVAVLDPKKDLRKQTRKMKTASGAVGGAVVGGLILGPVGVVLGASGGAAVSNKMAKSRDKRKQQEFEQRNFQKGAAKSVAAKGDGSFV